VSRKPQWIGLLFFSFLVCLTAVASNDSWLAITDSSGEPLGWVREDAGFVLALGEGAVITQGTLLARRAAMLDAQLRLVRVLTLYRERSEPEVVSGGIRSARVVREEVSNTSVHIWLLARMQDIDLR
jgi:hypothetical protein